jgi:dTDP-glucose 4,6-dehydratase
LLPKVISNALNDIRIPVYGKGDNVREWIFVNDHCRAIYEIYKSGQSGDIYNIGSGIETTNLALVKNVLTCIDKPFGLIKFVNDRLGHDFRYSIDSSKFMNLCPDFKFTEFNEGLDETIRWYSENI